LAGEAKRSMSPISEATVNALIHPNPRRGHQQWDVAMVGTTLFELDRQPRDLQLEVVDQPEAHVDVAPPRIGDLQTIEQIAPGETEQVPARARVPEGDQRRVDAFFCVAR
jgi:hypothetical protein